MNGEFDGLISTGGMPKHSDSPCGLAVRALQGWLDGAVCKPLSVRKSMNGIECSVVNISCSSEGPALCGLSLHAPEPHKFGNALINDRSGNAVKEARAHEILQ